MLYYLMHKNVKVSTVSIENDGINCKHVSGGEKHLPIGVKTGIDLIHWLQNRAVPVTRFDVNSIYTDTFSLMVDNLGLSLTDCYWLCPYGSEYLWEDLNFYDNSFVSSILLDVIDDTNRTGFVPSVSLKGDLKKKWIIDDQDNRVLVKGTQGSNSLQSISEVLVSKIYTKYYANFVNYKFIKCISADNEILGCCSKNFTSTSLEFVPAIDIVNSQKKPNDISYFQHFKNICESNNIQNVQEFFDRMIAVDFYIMNTDRHLNNVGILRNPDTLEWIKLAPIFDSGNSLFYKAVTGSKLPSGIRLLQTENASFYSTMSEQLKIIQNINLDSLQLSDTEISKLLCNDKSLTEFDIEQRVLMLRHTFGILEEFANGAKPWDYNYQKNVKTLETIRGFN